MGIDPAACGEFLEQRAIETARGAVVDILDRSLMAQPGIAQASEQAPIAAMREVVPGFRRLAIMANIGNPLTVPAA